MSQKFYNPYQFIPVTGTVNGGKPRAAIDPILRGQSTTHPWARHDLWHSDGLSGRILCSLYLATPTAVGAEQVKEDGNIAKLVRPYRWHGQPAIPGNSLKGLVGSVAEALSQSTLRVLESWQWPRAKKTHEYRVTDPDGDPRGKKVRLQTSLHDIFARIDRDLVPWIRGEERMGRNRTQLTPAELLFGVVEEVPSGAERDQDPGDDQLADREGRNFAGRVRFHDARSEREIKLYDGPPHTLRILNSPKLPCPAMYFHRRGQRGRSYMDKDAFHNHPGDNDILPNGRKFYLHHRQEPAHLRQQKWRTRIRDNPNIEKMQLRTQPMKEDQTLFFHVDFENLSRAELTLLEHALAPSPAYQHRLGLGKPLGLGSVVIGIEGVFLIDRCQRYARDAFAATDQRYHHCWRPTQSPAESKRDQAWGSLYPTEWAIFNGNSLGPKPTEFQDESLVDRDTLGILTTLGDPGLMIQGIEVHTPLAPGQTDPERKTYEWFRQNDDDGGQPLPAIIPGQKLEPLCADARDCRAPSGGRTAPGPTDPQVAAWLEQVIPPDVKANGPKRLAELILTRPMAEAVVGIPDADLRAQVFGWLKVEWHRQDPAMPLFNLVAKAAVKVYEKAGLSLRDDGTA